MVFYQLIHFFRNISFQVHRGEILGFGGLIGAGRTELVRAIYGVDQAQSGTVILDGKTGKIQDTLDYCRDVALKRSDLRITQEKVEIVYL